MLTIPLPLPISTLLIEINTSIRNKSIADAFIPKLISAMLFSLVVEDTVMSNESIRQLIMEMISFTDIVNDHPTLDHCFDWYYDFSVCLIEAFSDMLTNGGLSYIEPLADILALSDFSEQPNPSDAFDIAYGNSYHWLWVR